MTVRFGGLARPATHPLREWRVDADHGDVAGRWRELGGGADWPDEAQWELLAAEDRLDEAEPARSLTPSPTATVEVVLDLPMPGIAYVELG